MIGFGIDLAGYTTGSTSLAAIEIEDQTASVTLLRGSALSSRHDSGWIMVSGAPACFALPLTWPRKHMTSR